MSDGSAEHRDDGITDELLDRSAEGLELVARAFVVDAQQCADILGIARLRSRGRTDEVDENDGHDLPLLPTICGRCVHSSTALRAELRPLGVGEAARCTLPIARV